MKDNLVTQAILAGPQTAAPPAFNGLGWLAALNLGAGTAAAWIGGMVVVAMVAGLWRWRRAPFGHLANVLQWTVLLGASCFTLRCGGVAFVNWAWNPEDIVTNAFAQTLKGFIDPVAMTLGMASAALGMMAWDSIMAKLAVAPPPPIVVWRQLPMLKRPAAVVALAFVAAIGVVVLR